MTNARDVKKLIGISEGALTGRWADSRTDQRRRAAAELERIRAHAVGQVYIQDRKDARLRGDKKYEGRPCRYHPANRTRYVGSARCIICDRKRQDRRRMAVGTYGLRGQRKPRPPHVGQRHPFVIERPQGGQPGR